MKHLSRTVLSVLVASFCVLPPMTQANGTTPVPIDPQPVLKRYCDTGDWEILGACNPANSGQPCYQTKKKKDSLCKFTDNNTACVDYGIVTSPQYKRLGECMSNGVCRELNGSTWVEDGSNQIRSCATL